MVFSRVFVYPVSRSLSRDPSRMLTFPGHSRSLIDSFFNDEFFTRPTEFMFPTLSQRQLERLRLVDGDEGALGAPAIKDGKYSLALNMQNFKPEEVQVQMDADRMLKVTGRREVKSDDGSYELREYVHHFSLPEEVLHEQLSVKLEPTGQLEIEAPVKEPEKKAVEGAKSIPVEFVNKE